MNINTNSVDYVYRLGSISLSVLTTWAVSVFLFSLGLAVGHSGVVTALDGDPAHALLVGLLIAVSVTPTILTVKWVLTQRLSERQAWLSLWTLIGVILPVGFFMWGWIDELLLYMEESFTPGMGYWVNSAEAIALMIFWGVLVAVVVVGGPYCGVVLRERLS